MLHKVHHQKNCSCSYLMCPTPYSHSPPHQPTNPHPHQPPPPPSTYPCCQKGPTRHVYAWQIGTFWQDTLDVCDVIIFNVITLVTLDNLDTYDPLGLYCLNPDYKPKEDPNFFTYVDVTLLGCKYLCQNLHDLPCSQIIYMPFKQTCVLQPDVLVPVVPPKDNCTKIELYRRRRTIGRSHSIISGVLCQ